MIDRLDSVRVGAAFRPVPAVFHLIRNPLAVFLLIAPALFLATVASTRAAGPGFTQPTGYAAGDLVHSWDLMADGRTTAAGFHRGYLFFDTRTGSGFEVWDISDLTNPVHVHTADIGSTNHHYFFIGDNYINNAGGGDVANVWDLSDMTNVTAASLPYTVRRDPHRRDWFTLPYVITGQNGYHPPLRTVKIWDSRTDTVISEIDFEAEHGFAGAPLVVGNLMVVGPLHAEGVATYDVSDPADPVLLDVLTDSGTGYEPAIYKHYCALPSTTQSGEDHLNFVDFSDPLDLTLALSIPNIPGNNRYVQFQDEAAFLGSAKYDLSNFPSYTQAAAFSGNTDEYLLPLGNMVARAHANNTEVRLHVHQASPDSTGPRVSYHNPLDASERQAITSRVGLVINETLDATTVNDATFIVRPVGGADLTGTRSLTDKDVVTFVPDSDLSENTEYEVVLTEGGIHDVAGNPIEDTTASGDGVAYRFTFTTGDASDQRPTINSFTTDATTAVETGEQVTFTLDAGDDDPLEYRVKFGDGAKADWIAAGGSQQFTHTYSSPGNYIAVAQVREQGTDFRASAQIVTLVVHEPIPADLPTRSSPIVVDDANGQVWVVNPDNDTVQRIDPDTEQLLGAELSVGDRPVSVAVDAAGRAWVACRDDDTIHVITSSGALDGIVALEYGARPVSIVFDPAGETAYVAEEGRSRITRISAAGASDKSVTGNLALGIADPTADMTVGLQAHYAFEGDFTDSAGSNDGSNNGATLSTDARVGSESAAFDGASNNAVDLPASMIGADIGSVALWVKSPSNASGDDYIFYGSPVGSNGKGPETEMHLHLDDGVPEMFFRDDALGIQFTMNAGIDLRDDEWHHLAVTWEAGGKFRLFVDGAMLDSAAHPGSTYSFSDSIVLGNAASVCCSRSFYGKLDDVRLYDRVLSKSDIATLAEVLLPTHHPGALAVTGDGNRLLVNRFISGGVAENSSGTVWDIDLTDFRQTTRIALDVDTTTDDDSIGARGTPNYLRGLAIRPQGDRAWFSGKKDNVIGGDFRDNEALTFETTLRAIAGEIDLGNQSENYGSRVDIDNHGFPSSLAFGPLGTQIFLTMQGNNRIMVLDAFTGQILDRADTGLSPDGIAIYSSGNSHKIFVKNFMDRSVTILDGTVLIEQGQRSVLDDQTPATLSTVGSEDLSTSVLRGKQLFYSARNIDPAEKDANPSFAALDGYMACANCHLDGGHDGRTPDFTNRGEGLRNTITLRGPAGTGHGNVHWTANFDEIQDFALDIVDHFGGLAGLDADDSGEIEAGERPNDSLGSGNSGLHTDLDDLAAYVGSLGESTIPRSPHRDLNGNMTEAALRGRSLFRGETLPSAGTGLSCMSCHDPTTGYTDSTGGDGTGGLHDIGTLKSGSGSRLGGTLNGIDTPTLLGIHDTAPYLHDGSAAGLSQVFDQFDPDETDLSADGAAHNLSATGFALTTAERADLFAFLLQLDGRPETGAGGELLNEDFSSGMAAWSVGAGDDFWGVNASTEEMEYTDNKGGPNILYYNASAAADWSDYTVRARLRSTDDDPVGIAFYYDPGSQSYYLFDMTKTFDGGPRRSLSKVINGGGRQVIGSATDSFDYQGKSNPLDYDVEIRVENGGEIVVKFGEAGQPLQEIFREPTPNDLTQGTVALYNRWNRDSFYDNIIVTANSGGTTVVAADDTGNSVNEGAGATIDVLANDTGSGLSVSSVTQGNLGTVTNNGSDITYTPDTGLWSGSDTFTYTADDGSSTDTAEVTVNINATSGSDPVPSSGADSLPVALEFDLTHMANRINTTNDTWELAGDGKGIDGSGVAQDSLYILADDSVTGDFQAFVQLVDLTGPVTSRMGLMIRDDDGVGAKFIALGSDTGSGYYYRTRSTQDALADAETDASQGSGHTFGGGKWVLMDRTGDILTLAVDDDNSDYTQETTIDISGWSNTLHAGLYVSSGSAGDVAIGEFDNFSLISTSPLLNEDFEDGNMDGWTIYNTKTSSPGVWSVSNGQLIQGNNRPASWVFWNDPAAQNWTDYTVQSFLRAADDDSIGLLFCYQDENNHYRFEMNKQNNTSKLVRVENGNETTLPGGSVSSGYAEDTDYTLTINVSGGEITVELNDGSGAQDVFGGPVSDSTFATGSVGVYCQWQSGNPAGVFFDDILVTGSDGS